MGDKFLETTMSFFRPYKVWLSVKLKIINTNYFYINVDIYIYIYNIK